MYVCLHSYVNIDCYIVYLCSSSVFQLPAGWAWVGFVAGTIPIRVKGKSTPPVGVVWIQWVSGGAVDHEWHAFDVVLFAILTFKLTFYGLSTWPVQI